uniref:RING-type domain-containing protein n=1 Tax=Strigamia maritima TaxID=126957 RepID=T1JBF1_STRMM
MHARCAICSDLFDFIQDVAATLCGHIFHSSCLAQWLLQSKTCPQCRLKVTSQKIIPKLYFDTEEKIDEGGNSNNAQLINQVESCKADLAANNKEKVEMIKKITEFEDKIRALDVEKQTVQAAFWECKDNCKVFKRELKNMQILRSDNTAMKSELVELRKKITSWNNLKGIMDNATKDVEEMLDKCREKPQVDEVLKWHSVVRRELIKSDEERKKLKNELELTLKEKRKLELSVNEYKSHTNELEYELKFMEEERENIKRCASCFRDGSPGLEVLSSRTPLMESPKIGQRRHSNTQDWVSLSPEILPDKSSKIINKRHDPVARGSLKISTKRHMSDSSVPMRLKSSYFHFNGLGGCSKNESPFPIPKSKAPKLSTLEDFVMFD